jgi:hypothetical protein
MRMLCDAHAAITTRVADLILREAKGFLIQHAYPHQTSL